MKNWIFWSGAVLGDFLYFYKRKIKGKMAKKDMFHDKVKRALEKEGWNITHDPYLIRADTLNLFDTRMEVDLGAEKLLAAQKGTEKIAIEIKSLLGASLIYELHQLVGQFFNYQIGIEEQEPERLLYVAIPKNAYDKLAPQALFKKIIVKSQMRLIVYEPFEETIVAWKK